MIFVMSNPGPFSVSVFFSGKNLPTKIRLRKHSSLLDLDSEGLITEKPECGSKSRSFNKYNLQSYLVLLCEEESRWSI